MSTRGRLHGKTALVTGGAKRLGRAICEALAAEGADVLVHYNSSRNGAEDTAANLRGQGVVAQTLSANLGEPEQARALFANALDQAASVDILVNNASIFPSDQLAVLNPEGLIENLKINALAPLVLSTCFVEQDHPGSIVNLLDARIVDYDKEHVSYHVSKRVLHTLTCMMAIEYAPAVRVNAVAPGLVLPPEGEDTTYLEALAHSNPLNSHGKTQDIADAVLYLLNAEFVTGQVIYVDGGRHLRGRVYA